MGLSVFYPADIRNALLAAEQATTAALSDGDPRYLSGYRAALTTLALAFGLEPRRQVDDVVAWQVVDLNQ